MPIHTHMDLVGYGLSNILSICFVYYDIIVLKRLIFRILLLFCVVGGLRASTEGWRSLCQ